MKLVLAIIFTFFVSIVCPFEIYAQSSNCEQLKESETTRQGANELVFFKEKRTLKSIRGTAVLGHNEQPLENVFVEIFPYQSDKRIVGCRTGKDGKFSFRGLDKGKYTIKLSRSGGYKITEIYIKISPKSKNDKEIIGGIEVGT